ncbi:MAG: penicillin-binding transpeptidase domain-containing protein [Vicinamibacteria bacterium]
MASRTLSFGIAAACFLAAFSGDAMASAQKSTRKKVVRPKVRSVARAAAKAPARFVPVTVLVPPDASQYDQKIAEATRVALRGRTNVALVAMDPWTGRVLSVGNPQSGLLSAYQPCSVFKLVVAVAGLTEGVITPESRFNCTDGCWIAQGHGPIDLRRALAVSCNRYFEMLGEKLGFDTVVRYAEKLGLGSPTGVNIPGETAGAIPSTIPSLGIGHMSAYAQGVKTTAMQLAVLMSALVNGGVMNEPQFVGPQAIKVKERSRLSAPATLSLLAPGLFSSVTEGSAQRAFDPGFVASGKTGSCSGVGWFASSLGYPRSEMVVVTFVRGSNGAAASAVAAEFYRSLLGVQAPFNGSTLATAPGSQD